MSQKATKELLDPKLVFSFPILNFPYLVLWFFFLVKELEEPLTLIWTLLWYFKILFAIYREYEVFKIIQILVLIIVLRQLV